MISPYRNGFSGSVPLTKPFLMKENRENRPNYTRAGMKLSGNKSYRVVNQNFKFLAQIIINLHRLGTTAPAFQPVVLGILQ